jgi:hypothetical protein
MFLVADIFIEYLILGSNNYIINLNKPSDSRREKAAQQKHPEESTLKKQFST